MHARILRTPLPRIAVMLAILLMAAGAATPARAWWNGDWSYRVRIDADTTAKGANITAPIGHTQVLLRLHSGNFNFAAAKEDGSDLRVVAADDRTPLHFQIEKFDGLVDQVGLIWVDVPDVAPNAVTSVYLYWGNKNATNFSDGKGTFGGDDLLVYHFAEDNGMPHDTTAFNNNAQTAGKRVDGGMVGYGLHLDGKAPVRLAASPSLAIAAGQPTSWSMWVHPDDGAASGVLYDNKGSAGELMFGIDNKVPYAQVTRGAGIQRTPAGAALSSGWHLITVTASDRLTLFVDGQKMSELAGALPALDGAAVLGGGVAPSVPAAAAPAPADAPAPAPAPAPDAAVAPNFVGTIDEFRIAKGVVGAG